MKQFLVIADDLTGAAEIAGIGERYGLSTQLERRPPFKVSAELTVIDTDSRLLRDKAAALRIRDFARHLDLSSFDFIYKKTDSVLRGNIVSEVTVLLQASGRKRCVLLPQNPSRGRTILEGQYRINGVPLHQTPFADDADRPIRTSSVQQLLEPPPQIAIQNAASPADVLAAAQSLATTDIPAGGADFFEACLQSRGCACAAYDPPPLVHTPKLFICGSAAASRLTFIESMRALRASIFAMPDMVFSGDTAAYERWKLQIFLAVSKARSTVVFVAQPVDRDVKKQHSVRQTLANLVADIRGRCAIGSLCVEGGATAAAVCDMLEWNHLTVDGEIDTGCVGLNPGDPYIHQLIVKPGSYAWPARLCK